MDTRRELQKEFDEMVSAAEKGLQDDMNQLQAKLQSGEVDMRDASRKLATAMMTTQKQLESKRERMQRDLNIKLEKVDTDFNNEINRIQGQYKLWSVVLPPIPPLLIALAVLFVRRIRESEGVPNSRRRK
jgi:hypothetical protein